MFDAILMPYPSYRQTLDCLTDWSLKGLFDLASYSLRYVLCESDNPYRCPGRVSSTVTFWRDNKQAFICFALMAADEIAARGISDDLDTCGFKNAYRTGRVKTPDWFGWPEVHEQSKRILFLHGVYEAFIKGYLISKHAEPNLLTQFGVWGPFFQANGLDRMWEFHFEYTYLLEMLATAHNFSPAENPYSNFHCPGHPAQCELTITPPQSYYQNTCRQSSGWAFNIVGARSGRTPCGVRHTRTSLQAPAQAHAAHVDYQPLNIASHVTLQAPPN